MAATTFAASVNMGSSAPQTPALTARVSDKACRAIGSRVEKDGTCGFRGAEGTFFVARENPEGCTIEMVAPTTGIKQIR